MSSNKKISTYKIAAIGIMSAVAFISNWFSIPIGDITRLHFGNGFCVLSGLLLGPWAGGISAGLGGFFYDLTNPLYAKDAFITFIMKFCIGFITGWIANNVGKKTESKAVRLTASIVASLSYVVIYLAKNFVEMYLFQRLEMEATLIYLSTKLVASMTNAGMAVVIAMLMYPVFLTAMKRSGIHNKLL